MANHKSPYLEVGLPRASVKPPKRKGVVLPPRYTAAERTRLQKKGRRACPNCLGGRYRNAAGFLTTCRACNGTGVRTKNSLFK